MSKIKLPVYRLNPAKVKARRIALGVTLGREVSQREIADKAGLLAPNYARCEQEPQNPYLNNVMRIAKALGCLIEDLTSP